MWDKTLILYDIIGSGAGVTLSQLTLMPLTAPSLLAFLLSVDETLSLFVTFIIIEEVDNEWVRPR